MKEPDLKRAPRPEAVNTLNPNRSAFRPSPSFAFRIPRSAFV